MGALRQPPEVDPEPCRAAARRAAARLAAALRSAALRSAARCAAARRAAARRSSARRSAARAAALRSAARFACRSWRRASMRLRRRASARSARPASAISSALMYHDSLAPASRQSASRVSATDRDAAEPMRLARSARLTESAPSLDEGGRDGVTARSGDFHGIRWRRRPKRLDGAPSNVRKNAETDRFEAAGRPVGCRGGRGRCARSFWGARHDPRLGYRHDRHDKGGGKRSEPDVWGARKPQVPPHEASHGTTPQARGHGRTVSDGIHPCIYQSTRCIPQLVHHGHRNQYFRGRTRRTRGAARRA